MNKLWYKETYLGESTEDLVYARNHIQEIINLYCTGYFNVPEDITVDNLQQFLEIILKHYQLYNFHSSELAEICESIELYFHKAYFNDFPESFFPTYPKTDRRSLVLHIHDYIDTHEIWLLPEEVPMLIECMNVSDDKIIKMYDFMDNYFQQFDHAKRCNEEVGRRYRTIKKQRKEALESGKPIPIRPMGIELDLCYKTQQNNNNI